MAIKRSHENNDTYLWDSEVQKNDATNSAYAFDYHKQTIQPNCQIKNKEKCISKDFKRRYKSNVLNSIPLPDNKVVPLVSYNPPRVKLVYEVIEYNHNEIQENISDVENISSSIKKLKKSNTEAVPSDALLTKSNNILNIKSPQININLKSKVNHKRSHKKSEYTWKIIRLDDVSFLPIFNYPDIILCNSRDPRLMMKPR